MTVLDTSAVIDALRGGEYMGGKVSVITLIEFLRGIGSDKRSQAKELLEESYEVIGINNSVVLEYCRLHDGLRSKGETLPDADLLIAATAISENEPLRTADADFRRLVHFGLKLQERSR